MKTLNLGILAHVDAGKTSLTERLLYTAGVIDQIGSVDAGNTQTDTLALERQRGITIKSAVASFVINDTTINLIDTPGHPDFIAEVERVLSVLDGVVLVISAVEGVQAQTRVLMRALQRLRIPTLIFVNKIDRSGARYESLLQEIADKLTPKIVPMGKVEGLGARSASFVSNDQDDMSLAELATQTNKALSYPVFFGSAITGAGVEAMASGIISLLPVAEGKADDAVSGSVFKIERGRAGQKIAYVRMFSGRIRVRERLRFGNGKAGRITAISVFDNGSPVQHSSIVAGEIGKVWGLGDVQVGDTVGSGRVAIDRHQFAPPTLETVVLPRNIADKGKLHVALDQLAEQDPLINLRQDDIRQETYVSLYGEVQKEVIQATLVSDFGIDVEFQKTTPICIERPIGTGSATRLLQEETNPTSATVGLHVAPAPMGSGVQFQLNVNPRLMPLYIYKTKGSFIEHMTEYIRSTFQEGLFGWQVTDCVVTMKECNYYVGDGLGKPSGNTPRTIASDFRKLTPLVLIAALKQAGTVVCQPICHFELEIPANALSAVLSVLAKLNATPQKTEADGSVYLLQGTIPAARVHELQQQLPALTGGEGVLDSVFAHYEPIRAQAPTRPRTDRNPL